MNDWFEWNGVKCTVYGIHVSEQPPVSLPEERVTYTPVPGRAGNLTALEGDNVYEDQVLAATCFVADLSRIDEIAAWLRGSGTVTFANRQGGYYRARVCNQISFEKILRGNPAHSFTVNFRCQPFFYLTPGNDIVLTQSGQFITNPGCVASEPMITISGSGDIQLMVGQQTAELTGISSQIVLDSEMQEAYLGQTTQNEKMSGDFPLLQPGSNAVSWTGNVTGVTVKPRWRTL